MTTLTELATTDEAVWPVPKSGALFGKGQSQSYVMAARGELPTLRLNGRLVVPVPLLRQMVGLSPPGHEEAPAWQQGPVLSGGAKEEVSHVEP